MFFYRANLFFMRRFLLAKFLRLFECMPAVNAIYNPANQEKMKAGREILDMTPTTH